MRDEKPLELCDRINGNIARALSQENPILSLDAFCRVTFQKGEIEEEKSSREGKIHFYKSPLPKELEIECIKLFESNMGKFYRSSSWGLNLKEKRKELRHPDARFLILKEESSTNNGDGSQSNIIAFSHFRFEVNDDDYPTEEVMYVYELQVDQTVRRSGLGKKIMTIMELLAMRAKMRKVSLTVFKNNEAAMNFYLKKMKYCVDDFSPSKYMDDNSDYEILSKCVHREKK